MLHRTIFVEEPQDKRHRGGLYKFKRDDPNDNMVYYCNGDMAEVYKLANAILDKIDDPEILELIYEYGEALTDNSQGDWYDYEAGEAI